MKKQSENETDVVGLITKMQEQLTSLDKKVDSLIDGLINRSLSRPPEQKPSPRPFYKPFQQSGNFHGQADGRQDNRHRDRMMYKAICGDCKKECQVPFKPSGERPVYCQDCFARRKAGNTFQPSVDNRPKETAPAQESNFDKPRAYGKKKFGAKKIFGDKKKSFSKKKKSKR